MSPEADHQVARNPKKVLAMNLLVNIDVENLSRAVQFYSTAFGLHVGRQFGASGVEMLGSSAPIYLLVKAEGTPAGQAAANRRSYERHWTPVHLDFVVHEIGSAVQTAILAGARLERAITTNPWGKLALMADPFGHGFCFIQFLGRGYDEIIEGQPHPPFHSPKSATKARALGRHTDVQLSARRCHDNFSLLDSSS